MLKLKLQYFGHVMWRTDSLEKTLMLGKIEGKRKRGWQEEKGMTGEGDGWMASPTRWTWVSVNSGIWWWTGRPGMLQSMGSQRVGHDWATELNWTEQDMFFYTFIMDLDIPRNQEIRGQLSFRAKHIFSCSTNERILKRFFSCILGIADDWDKIIPADLCVCRY